MLWLYLEVSISIRGTKLSGMPVVTFQPTFGTSPARRTRLWTPWLLNPMPIQQSIPTSSVIEIMERLREHTVAATPSLSRIVDPII